MHSFVTVYSGMTIQIFIKIGSYLTDMEQKISWHSFLRHGVLAACCTTDTTATALT